MGAKGQKLTAEQRANIGAGIRRRYQENRALWIAEPTHKHCKRCGRTKPLHEFGLRKQRLASGEISITPWHPCKKCVARRTKARRELLRVEGKLKAYEKRQRERRDKGKQRAYVRESKAKRRREEGRPVRGPGRKQAPSAGKKLPAEPLLELLRDELPRLAKERNDSMPTSKTSWGTKSDGSGPLAEISGVPARRLYDLLHGRSQRVSLSTVDKLLHGLGQEHMLPILYPEDQ